MVSPNKKVPQKEKEEESQESVHVHVPGKSTAEEAVLAIDKPKVKQESSSDESVPSTPLFAQYCVKLTEAEYELQKRDYTKKALEDLALANEANGSPDED